MAKARRLRRIREEAAKIDPKHVTSNARRIRKNRKQSKYDVTKVPNVRSH